MERDSNRDRRAMVILYTILIIVFYTHMAYQGLIGAVTKNFRLPKSSASGIKHYTGNTAYIWGIIFFVAFFGFGHFVAFGFIKSNNMSLIATVVSLSIGNGIGYAIAYAFRHYGIYKI